MPGLFNDIPPVAEPLQANPLTGLHVTGPAMPTVQAPPSRFQRFLNMMMPSTGLASLMDPAQRQRAQRLGLMQFGLNMLASSRGTNGSNAPGFGQALAGSVNAGQTAYQNAAEQTVGGELQAQQIGNQQSVLENRAKIAAMFPPGPNETPQQQALRTLRMFNAYVSAGDTEMAGKLGEVLKSMGGVLQGDSKVTTPQEIALGGHKILRDPKTGKVIADYPMTPSPRDPNAPDTAKQLRDQRMFQREQQLTDDFNKDTKTYRELHLKIAGALNELPNALAGDGAAQTNILYSFISAMDPSSAVREGEMSLVQAAAPLRAQAQALIQKYLNSGESVAVPQIMLQKMGELMARRQKVTENYVDERSKYYTGRAKHWGLDATDLFPGVTPSGGGGTRSAGGRGDANKVQAALSGRP